MDFDTREALIKRIADKTLYCTVNYNGQEYDVIFKDPSLQLVNYSNFLYQKQYNKFKNSKDFITLQESYNILKDDGKWSDTLENELQTLKKDITTMQEKLASNEIRFKKIEQKHISKLIEKANNRIQELEKTKNQLYHLTLESTCLQEKRRFLVKETTSFLSNLPNWELNTRLLDVLVVYYFQEYSISMKDIRELARSDPWRLYWTASKDSNIQLFPHSSVEMSDWQYLLVFWSKVYDMAFASSNPPPDSIINDDNLFDAWCKSQHSEQKDSNIPNDLNINGVGVQEIFIMADEEGAKEVLEMNNPLGLHRIQNINKAITTKGEVNEVDLPDIQIDLKMAANQAMPPK